jgi:type I site-specific restriction endonuclease
MDKSLFTHIRLNLPPFEFNIRNEGQSSQIFDTVRRKFVALTPEEWVRQHFIHYLKKEKGFPYSLMAVEKQLRVNNLSRRADIVLHGKDGKPLMAVECKAPSVKISQEVFDQAARYNISLNVPFFVLTNGMDHFCCASDEAGRKYIFLEEIPSFNDIRNKHFIISK